MILDNGKEIDLSPFVVIGDGGDEAQAVREAERILRDEDDWIAQGAHG